MNIRLIYQLFFLGILSLATVLLFYYGLPFMIVEGMNIAGYGYFLSVFLIIASIICGIAILYGLFRTAQLFYSLESNSLLEQKSPNANLLHHIELATYVSSGSFTVLLYFFYLVAEYDDAPGVILFTFVFLLLMIFIGLFARMMRVKILELK